MKGCVLLLLCDYKYMIAIRQLGGGGAGGGVGYSIFTTHTITHLRIRKAYCSLLAGKQVHNSKE